jgi:hypothetical protein
MGLPLAAMAGKYLIGEAMDRMGANKDLKGLVMGPKAFMVDKLKGAVDQAAGVAPGTTDLITNPKGAMLDAAKNYAQDYAKEKFNDVTGNRPSQQDFTRFDNDQEYSDLDVSFGEGEYKRGGKVKRKPVVKQPKASSASRRGDGIAQRGKTKGRYL